MPQNSLTPLNNVTSEVVRFNVPLPAYVAPHIGVDVDLLERMCKAAGIGSLEVSSQTNSDSIFSSITNNGSSTAALTSTRAAAASRVSATLKEGKDVSGYKCANWSDAHVMLNMDALQNEQSESTMPVTDPSSWVGPLNRAVRQGMTKAAMQSLFQTGFADTQIDMVYGIIMPSLVTGLSHSDSIAPYLVGAMACRSAELGVMMIYRAMGKTTPHRLSAHYFGIELSRIPYYIAKATCTETTSCNSYLMKNAIKAHYSTLLVISLYTIERC